jgi:hypothetical protein
VTPERDPQYLTLVAAARHALCQLSPALARLLVERAAFEAGLAKLARAGVRFSEVRPESGPRRLPTVSPMLSPA